MNRSTSTDNIDVLNQEIVRSRIDTIRSRFLEIRDRVRKAIKKKKKQEPVKEKENSKGHHCHSCHACCFIRASSATKKPKKEPVLYKVFFKEVLYEIPKQRRPFKLRKERSVKSYNYECVLKDDFVRKSWEQALQHHSDLHPIVYNGTLWTDTTSARKRIQNLRGKSSTCPGIDRNLFLRHQKLTIEKEYLKQPHKKASYTVEKQIVLQLHQNSIAQWRF